MSTLYSQIGGFDIVLALCRRWHELCLADPDAAHPFEHINHPQHDERLAAYLSEAFGGPKLYTAGYGDETSVQRMHACNGEHIELDEACLRAFDQALADVGINGETATALSAYFRDATVRQRAYARADNPVPDGLPFNYARSSLETAMTRYRLGSAHIFVDDLPVAREFYVDKLGMKLTYEEAGFLIFDTGESTFMVFDGRGGGDRIGGGTGLHFSVEAVDDQYAELVDKGVEMLGTPQTHDWGGRMVGFRDPAGNVSHLVQYS